MGALHRGHATLIEHARTECDCVVVSIFVNPLQFGPAEDYARYPRSLDKDAAICDEQQVDFIFAPTVAEMYPGPQAAFVEVERLGEHLCGAYRPGHFRGVATVVLKLFNVVQPDRAYFGEKDYQQLAIIRRMTQDLNLTIAIAATPTVREDDGLALSSRNAYLTAEERRSAPALYRALKAARDLIESGESDSETIKQEALRVLAEEPALRVQYLEIVDPMEVQPVNVVEGPVRIAAAAFLGATRLIDNIEARFNKPGSKQP